MNLGPYSTYPLQVCAAGHCCHQWCSQAMLNNRLAAGDLRLAFAVLTSGNNFKKIKLFASHLGLEVLSESSFHKLQRFLLIPSINEAWLQHQRELVDTLKEKRLVLLGKFYKDSHDIGVL